MDDQTQIAGETPPVNKFLLRLVTWLGVILLLLFFALVGGIIYKSANKPKPSQNPADVLLGIGLPPNEKFESVVLSGDRLTVNTGSQIYVIDVPARRVLLKVQGRQD